MKAGWMIVWPINLWRKQTNPLRSFNRRGYSFVALADRHSLQGEDGCGWMLAISGCRRQPKKPYAGANCTAEICWHKTESSLGIVAAWITRKYSLNPNPLAVGWQSSSWLVLTQRKA